MTARGRAVIFIGHYKAGTTSLQAFLAANYGGLAKHGILYPAVENAGLACQTSRALGLTDGVPWQNQNVIAPHNALAFRLLVDAGRLARMPGWFKGIPDVATMLAAIDEQTRHMRAPDLILCSEVLSTFADLPPEATETIRAIVGERRVRIVCTLRRPDDHLMSWHAHRLRLGDRIEPLRDGAAADYVESVHFDYARMLGHWTSAFPGAECVVRNYADVAAAGGSCMDFLATSGLDMPAPAEMTFPPQLNVGFHRALVEIARRGNHALAPIQARQLRRLLDRIRDDLDLPPSRSIEMLGRRMRRRMRSQFAPIASRLRRLPGAAAMFDDLREMVQTAPVAEIDAATDALAQIRARDRAGLRVDPAVVQFLDGLEIGAPAA